MKQIAIITLTLLISMNSTGQDKAVATFGGGCFWCTEAFFTALEGVEKVVSGYSGGKAPNPTYKEVCTGLTGHAEVVQITYNPNQIGFEDLLEVFFATHNPTTLNRQGADVGTQYRSVVFYHTQEQKQITELVIKELEKEKIFNDPIVTEVSPFDQFYEAEDYHQDYFANNPRQPYCNVVINPKMEKFKKLFKEKLKK
ncbi:peptide-methionine (S)-S-oxide reductase MsrA [Carboxylicivirga mesophila]|uniref:Peptide methionine sulfoxide reductase MsrA n=1 Tax=Carboxylicivirga mesophila TaxID=1166478 RepID=A0ABS5KGV8_9BACT|nr:peptide-methionine (S)-S-oxide reductase MsrA [Carboxylicivirga mesophila]MBS2213721.1 peptide-methionine (S)-S-oxide reductase MsrA [Carboxylicivirga mesophila]